jgi:hypothetical protein
VHGQVQDSVLQNKIAIDSILASEQLNKLEGRPATFYSKGHEVRAKAIHDLVRGCVLFYEAQFPGRKFDLRVYVLDKNDWERAPFGNPYGLINYYPDNILEIIPADKNALTRLVGAPDDSIQADSIISGYDAGALHELGHYFIETLYHLRKSIKDKWLHEVMATYFSYCYLKEKHSQIASGIEELVKPPLPQPKYKSLQDFQNLYGKVGPENYDWYQRRFAQLDFALYPQLKLELIKKVIENYSPGGKNLDGISLLKKLAPETMNEWLKEMQ